MGTPESKAGSSGIITPLSKSVRLVKLRDPRVSRPGRFYVATETKRTFTRNSETRTFTGLRSHPFRTFLLNVFGVEYPLG